MPHRDQFVHLHVHSVYSLLDGGIRLTELIDRANELGQKAVAVTDHGNLYAGIKFYRAALAGGVKPILGCELYVAPRTRHDKETREDRSPYHLTLLAKNLEGYQNLVKLASLASLEGFYSRPRIDREIIEKYHKGLIVLSGCPAGEIGEAIAEGRLADAKAAAGWYRELLGEDYYLEIQDLGLEINRQVNPGLIKLSKDLKIKLVATNDAHYLRKQDSTFQDILMCIQTGALVSDEKRMRLTTPEFYIKSADEMLKLFSDIPEAVKQSREIADQCEVKLEMGTLHLPNFIVPEGQTPDSFLENLVWEGIKGKYGSKVEGKVKIAPEINDRVKYELYTIEKMGYAPYFLIVQDFINYARSQDIQVGPGRGSAAGSIVSYALGITNIDPLRYDLLFERFLNLERVSMPDIDIDFCFERRQEVIDYVSQKYGKDHVAQIITFGTMAARGGIRDVGRVKNIPLPEVDRIAKMVPFGPNVTIAETLGIEEEQKFSPEGEPIAPRVNKELQALYRADDKVKDLLDAAMMVEGLPRHGSVHAAGVVISEKPLMDHLPIQDLGEGQIVTQYDMTDLEAIGLLKMDFLGLRNLTMIAHAVANVGGDLDMGTLPLDDLKTYQLLCAAETVGVFQLESRGMRALLKDLQPVNFTEVIDLLALYRPGPLESGMVADYVSRKHGRTEVKYDLPELMPILKDTHGVILYQEQVMQIASKVAGYSLGQADILRRAMGKKKSKEMQEQKERFVEGAVKRGVSHNKAVHLFNLCAKFAGYGFNKSHSAAYALISYQTAYLKANHPPQFMAALLTSVMGNTDKVTLYISECQRMGLKVLPPDINESGRNFTCVPEGLRFGLTAIKNVGVGAIDSIIENREKDGPYKDQLDFFRRVDTRQCNKKVIESLIKSGAFDSLGLNRATLLAGYEKLMGKAAVEAKERSNGQEFLFSFDKLQPSLKTPEESALESLPEIPRDQLLKMEKELLGFYISHHPLEHLREMIENLSVTKVADIADSKVEGDQVTAAGLLSSCRKFTTKKGDLMMVSNLEDLSGTITLVVFPKTFEKYSGFLVEDAVVVVKGRINRDARTEELNVAAESIEPLEELQKTRSLFVELGDITDKKVLDQLKQTLQFFRGADPVIISYDGRKVAAHSKYHVDINPEMLKQLEGLLGREAVKVEFQYLKKEENVWN
ncbi:DNA polymerase III subunit alpha [Candidatus Saganbacteria bacterium]|nr:DNA polymerase III subunit alpha [Candidatus Saganbacteria bacterium]